MVLRYLDLKNRDLAAQKAASEKNHAEGQALVANMERTGASDDSINAMYANLSGVLHQIKAIDLEMSINVLIDANKKRKQEIEALAARVATLERV